DVGTLTKRVSYLESLVITLENKVEELIGRTTDVNGIINEQRSTIEDGIMVIIRGPPGVTGLHGLTVLIHVKEAEEVDTVDGQWASWSTWSTCSGSCGDGVETRNRSCSDPTPANGGKVCPGPDIETNPCNLQQCVKYDCSDVLKLGLSRGSGDYRITSWNTDKEVDVYCDMDTDGGGWTYEQGFGSLDGEFWMGLDLLHSITSRANMTLRIDVSLTEGTTGFDEYSGFYISPPDQYNFNVDRRINSARMSDSFLLSTIGDALDINHRPFTTYDRDVDKLPGNCAGYYGGGWWYSRCAHSNLNAQYNSGGFQYYSFKQSTMLKTSTMMLRLSN
ncbi:FGL2-like protein, partial [Mya arenaria]